MPSNLFTLTSITKKVKEATVVMIGKRGIVIVLVTRASHIMWRRNKVALALNLRVAAALPAAATFQATAAL
eukprot:2228974-Ditylum_brightwellii.AAC.1